MARPLPREIPAGTTGLTGGAGLQRDRGESGRRAGERKLRLTSRVPMSVAGVGAGRRKQGELGWRVRHGPERAREGRELASGPGERRELGRGVCWARMGEAAGRLERREEKEAGWAVWQYRPN
jgi:hypothetical protein